MIDPNAKRVVFVTEHGGQRCSHMSFTSAEQYAHQILRDYPRSKVQIYELVGEVQSGNAPTTLTRFKESV